MIFCLDALAIILLPLLIAAGYGGRCYHEKVMIALPVTLASTILLGLLGIGVSMAVLGEVLGDVVLWAGSAVGQGRVVSVVGFVGASH